MGLLQKLLSEYIGTFFLVLVGPGAIIINEMTSGAIGHLGIATVSYTHLTLPTKA